MVKAALFSVLIKQLPLGLQFLPPPVGAGSTSKSIASTSNHSSKYRCECKQPRWTKDYQHSEWVQVRCGGFSRWSLHWGLSSDMIAKIAWALSLYEQKTFVCISASCWLKTIMHLVQKSNIAFITSGYCQHYQHSNANIQKVFSLFRPHFSTFSKLHRKSVRRVINDSFENDSMCSHLSQWYLSLPVFIHCAILLCYLSAYLPLCCWYTILLLSSPWFLLLPPLSLSIYTQCYCSLSWLF